MKIKKIVNLTPHPLVFADGLTIESSGVARCETTEQEIYKIELPENQYTPHPPDVINHAPIPVIRTCFGSVVGLPDPVPGVVYVVSSITAQAVVDRMDVYVPARPIRDEKGRIIACAALGRI
jgi:hypothetical protein